MAELTRSVTGYAAHVLKREIQSRIERRLIGPPYVAYGSMVLLAVDMFELSGLLARKMRNESDTFVSGYLGQRLASEELEAPVRFTLSESRTFGDFVIESEVQRLHFMGSPERFSEQYREIKLDPQGAEKILWRYVLAGSFTGLYEAEKFLAMYESSYPAVPLDPYAQKPLTCEEAELEAFAGFEQFTAAKLL